MLLLPGLDVVVGVGVGVDVAVGVGVAVAVGVGVGVGVGETAAGIISIPTGILWLKDSLSRGSALDVGGEN